MTDQDVLAKLAKFDDREWVFRIGEFHGESRLYRTTRTGKPAQDDGARYPYCKKHKSWSCGVFRVATGIEAARWALEREADE